jgi:hypothetical protein
MSNGWIVNKRSLNRGRVFGQTANVFLPFGHLQLSMVALKDKINLEFISRGDD